MNLRKGKLIILIIIMSLLCFACNNKEQVDDQAAKLDAMLIPTEALEEAAEELNPSNAPSSEPTLAPTLTPEELPKPDTDYVNEEMLANAILAEGNLARLAAAMKKAKNGEEITVGVIGGSITQGSSASNKANSYAERFYRWWGEAFPDTKVNYINAGIGATSSYLGVHRVDQDLLSYKPDVVIVEFSVNDSDTIFYKESYEDLMRKILKAENKPAIIQLFMTMENGTSAQNSHLHLGFIYDLPRISYGEMVLSEIEKGSFSWKDISPDNIHPNDRGHAMVGEVLWDYLNSVYDKLDTITEEPLELTTEPFANERFMEATILDSANIEPIQYGSFEKASVNDHFRNNWRSTSGNEAIIFETEAKNIGVMFYKTIDGKGGQYEVFIDGELKYTLNADFKNGWGNYAETIEVYRSEEKKMHRIEIRKSDNSTGDVFTILGLLIS